MVSTQFRTTEDTIGRSCDCRSDDIVELERAVFCPILEMFTVGSPASRLTGRSSNELIKRATHLLKHDREARCKTSSDLIAYDWCMVWAESDTIAHRPLDLLLLEDYVLASDP